MDIKTKTPKRFKNITLAEAIKNNMTLVYASGIMTGIGMILLVVSWFIL